MFVSLNTVSLYSILPIMLENQKRMLQSLEVITERPTVLACHGVDGSETLELLMTGTCAKQSVLRSYFLVV